ncbi:MAG: ATP-binding protein [Defluviitaleaceae bacterium]|nr:ATP-binding protein [Defluviitaleaceae bacterium]
MKTNISKSKQYDMNEHRLKNKFIFFSAVLFLLILVVGSMAFVFSMRQIVRANKGIELQQMLDIERLRLESTLEAKISMIRKMADSPLIIRHFENPDDDALREMATEEINSFRKYFNEGYEISWVNDIDRLVYSTEFTEPYWLDADNPAHYWYYATLYETQGYSFNVNYNPNTEAFKMWVNAPVLNNERKPVGMVALALEVTVFINRFFHNIEDGVDIYLFNSAGVITGAKDVDLVIRNANIMDELGESDIDIVAKAVTFGPGETQSFAAPRGTLAIGTVPALGWYAAAFKPYSISDYFTPMTTLFLVMIVVISLIFIIFNLFIARFIKSISEVMVSLENAGSEAEKQLLRLNLMVRATKIGMWDIKFIYNDAAAPIESVTWSDEFRQLLGYTDATDFPNVLNSWSDCIHSADKNGVMDSFEKHITDTDGKTPFDIEYRMKKKNGEWAYYRDTGETTRDESGNPLHIAGALLDITETKNLISEIERQRMSAEAANKAKSAFLSTMSHEIRTPMNAVLGITEIQLYKNELDPEIREALEKVYTSGELLLGIINDILDLSKIEAGKLELLTDKYDIASLVSDTAQLNMMRIGSKRINFELNIDANMPAQFSGDELRIKQILNNLLSNAFKYTDAGRVSLTITTEAVAENSKKAVLVVIVSDTGQGMTKEQVDKLFDEYTRFNQEANNTTEGTGLGMNITRNLVELMGGSIAVESKPSIGSTFTVRLPQDLVGTDVLGREVVENLQQFRTCSRAQMRKIKITREPMPYGKILIVDDVETNIYVTKGLLTPYRLAMDSADSGFAAIDKIKDGNTYDVVFMDHMMPKMDGVETTKRLRDMGYKDPIVALTANAVAGQADMFLENGFDDFISKPIDLRQMNIVLNKFIRDKQSPEIIEVARQDAMSQKSSGQSEPVQKVENQTKQSMANREIVGLDIFKGIERYDGDEKTYLKILRSYARSTRSTFGLMETVTEDGITNYGIRVHGIKGASYDIFANGVGKEAEILEFAARDGNLSLIQERNPAFLVMVGELLDNIEVALSAIEDENQKPKKDKPDNESLVKLLAACDIYNMKNADAIMTEIEEYQYTADGGLAVWLRENIDIINFRKIVERLSDYLESEKSAE